MKHRRSGLAGGLVLAACTLSSALQAATLCVSKNPNSACPYSTITAAVNAASPGDVIQVSQGIYHEDVVIGKAISLIGANRSNTIIDATGLPNGIYVDGLHNPGLQAVFISGITVQNANYEGILLTNTSYGAVQDTLVTGANRSLNTGNLTCPVIPSFETAEDFDCGEGIHLSGVDHEVIASNIVENNAGGILLSDDTGETHDNLIMNNLVQDNPFDCGITLASHPLAGPVGPQPTAAGVDHNTILGNIARRNGRQLPGAGAGVGLFSPAPFTKTFGNVVVNNTLMDNGLPGVSMHAHSAGANLNDNMIAGNTISGNGADTEDTFTPGPTGINVSGGDDGMGNPVAVISGTVVAGNTIQQESIAVAAKTNAVTPVHLNNFINVMTGVDNLASGGLVGAKLNWWGCAQGPGAPGCANTVGSNILTLPFLTKPF